MFCQAREFIQIGRFGFVLLRPEIRQRLCSAPSKDYSFFKTTGDMRRFNKEFL